MKNSTRVVRMLGWVLAAGIGAAGALWPHAAAVHAQATAQAAALPAKLTDAEFWKLTSDISEPGGYFRIVDNFTSNENEVGKLMTALTSRGVKGGVYVGVGPEQNLSYISAVRPAMAFIIDIRRQAVMQHLMFKAMMELSKDRGDFLSMLFAKPKPEKVTVSMPIQAMWSAFFDVLTDQKFAMQIHDRVVQHLTKTHGFTFTADEQTQFDAVMAAFVQYGPGITTNGSATGRGGGGNGRNPPLTFADLTGWSTDDAGVVQSFMASDESFQAVKALHDKNLVVAVSGDFGGPKALRAIGNYVREHGSTVSAFYVSNVEQYLVMDGKEAAFYDNVASLPLTDASVFIRAYSLRNYLPGLCGIKGAIKTFQAGRVVTWNDAQACSPN